MILGHPLLGAQVAEHRVLVQIVSSHNENNYTHLCFVRKRSPGDFFSILLERLFVGFLTELQPKPEYVRLFGEIIVDVWKSKQGEVAALRGVIQRRLSELRVRKDRLVEAFVYRRAIDQATYQEQLDKLNEELTLTEIEDRDAGLDELDVQAAVNFAEYVLLNAARLWTEFSLDQKQRLQEVLFPRGVQFMEGAYRTAETSMVFFDLQKESTDKECLVAVPGIEPGFPD